MDETETVILCVCVTMSQEDVFLVEERLLMYLWFFRAYILSKLCLRYFSVNSLFFIILASGLKTSA